MPNHWPDGREIAINIRSSKKGNSLFLNEGAG